MRPSTRNHSDWFNCDHNRSRFTSYENQYIGYYDYSNLDNGSSNPDLYLYTDSTSCTAGWVCVLEYFGD